MKKVVLLGDSIRLMGYGEPVAKSLSEDFEVWQPSENCRHAQHTLRGLFDWREDLNGADIIHWNNGHWDLCDLFGDGNFTPIDRYVEEMVRIATLLKARAKTVIFATTTPVRPENRYNKNSDVERFNQELIPRLKEMGIVINDLYTPLSRDIPRYICSDLIHLSEEGTALCAQYVEDAIRAAAKALSEEAPEVVSTEGPNESGAPI